MASLNLFLSYSHADKTVARRIQRRLTAHGIKVWFDDHELRIGATLTDAIRTHIKNADNVLVIASQNSADSLWVKMELNFAKEHDKPVIPIFIEPLSAHERFKDYRGVDACSLESFGEAVDKLMLALYDSIEEKLPPADREILISNLHELAKEEPNLGPLIFGYLDSAGLHRENIGAVYSVTFHALDETLNSLFEIYPRPDMASCVASGFNIAGAGTRALSSWIDITGDGELALVSAVGDRLATRLIPTAIKLLGLCSPPNNHALYNFIDKNNTLLDESQQRSVIRLVTWPVRSNADNLGDVLAWVAFKSFPSSGEIEQMWVRWIHDAVFDHKPKQLADYLVSAHQEQLSGWERINDALRIHVRSYVRSCDKAKVYIAMDHVMAAAREDAPVLNILLNETRLASGTAEWDKWRKLDPDTAEYMGWYVHCVGEEALGEKNWMRALDNAKKMVAFEEQRKKFLNGQDDNS